MAVISSKDWRNSTILDLWEGSTRAKHRAWWQASLWAARDSSSNSRPVKALVDTSSSSPKIPMRRQMATAVPLLSPVIIITLMPACLHSFMDEATSILGGSSIPTQPTNVRLVWNKIHRVLVQGSADFSSGSSEIIFPARYISLCHDIWDHSLSCLTKFYFKCTNFTS